MRYQVRGARVGRLLPTAAASITVVLLTASLTGAAGASPRPHSSAPSGAAVRVDGMSVPLAAAVGRRHPEAKLKAGPLSGRWSGTYSGAFSGTFHLTWRQLGDQLRGTIAISGFGNAPTSIHGAVRGTSIKFGTVGSKAITYSGTVAGGSMSGTWRIAVNGRSLGGGSWRASKSS